MSASFRSPSAPLHSPFFTTPRYPGCSRVRQLQCYEIGARGRDERGRMGGTGVVSRRRYRPLSNPVATLKGNHRKRGCGAFNSSRFRFIFDISQEEKEGGFFYNSLSLLSNVALHIFNCGCDMHFLDEYL